MLTEERLASATAHASPPFDFRRPSKFGREHVRSLENLHESFARRFANALTHLLRTVVQVKPVAVDEITYENYLRSLPNPSVLAVIALPPLPGMVILETSAPIAIQVVDRVLGGIGGPSPLRRPTELETRLIEDVFRHGLGAFEETFAPLVEIRPEVSTVETNPNFVQAVPPSETTLLLSYSLSLSASSNAAEGLLTLCYPYSTLHPVMDRLHKHVAVELSAADADTGSDKVEVLLADVEVPVSVGLKATVVSAGDVAAIRPGDVLRLDHRVDEPAVALVCGVELFDGFVGRKGKRLGFRFSSWRS